jgi:hypothetical protein
VPSLSMRKCSRVPMVKSAGLSRPSLRHRLRSPSRDRSSLQPQLPGRLLRLDRNRWRRLRMLGGRTGVVRYFNAVTCLGVVIVNGLTEMSLPSAVFAKSGLTLLSPYQRVKVRVVSHPDGRKEIDALELRMSLEEAAAACSAGGWWAFFGLILSARSMLGGDLCERLLRWSNSRSHWRPAASARRSTPVQNHIGP